MLMNSPAETMTQSLALQRSNASTAVVSSRPRQTCGW